MESCRAPMGHVTMRSDAPRRALRRSPERKVAGSIPAGRISRRAKSCSMNLGKYDLKVKVRHTLRHTPIYKERARARSYDEGPLSGAPRPRQLVSSGGLDRHLSVVVAEPDPDELGADRLERLLVLEGVHVDLDVGLLGVAHHLRGLGRGEPRLGEDARRRVPQVVRFDVPEPGLLSGGDHATVAEVVGGDRLAARDADGAPPLARALARCEDEVAVLAVALAPLDHPLRLERARGERAQDHAAVARAGLGDRVVDQATLGVAHKLAVDPEHAALRVDVAPPEPAKLGDAQAGARE